MPDKDIIEKAQKRVQDKKDLFTHLITYASVSLFLIGLNLFTTPDYMWFLFPIGGWGIGVLIHAFTFYAGSKTSDWEEKELQKEINKMRKNKMLTSSSDEYELPKDKLELRELEKKERRWDDEELV